MAKNGTITFASQSVARECEVAFFLPPFGRTVQRAVTCSVTAATAAQTGTIKLEVSTLD